MSVASKELHLALMMALWTGQRQGDLLALPRDAYDGTTIRLTQSKSKGRRAVSIKVGFPLKAVLDQTPRRIDVHPDQPEGRFMDIRWVPDVVGQDGRQGRDREPQLPRSAWLDRDAPLRPQEIASVTGHGLQDVSDILDAHYLGERTKLAEMAVKRLERKERREKKHLKAVK